MMQSTDSIPAITEKEATGEIAELYEDLRVTLGVPFVNLIWRHLATIPGGLSWTWNLVKPLYVSGEVIRLSIEASELISLPSIVTLPDFVWDSANVDLDVRKTIVRLIESYNRANGVNFFALIVARSVLRDGLPTLARVTTARQTVSCYREPFRALPPLLAFAELPPPVFALVRRLDEFGRLESSKAIASLYRHLAHWPEFLSIIYTSFEPLHRSGELTKAQLNLIAFGQRQCSKLLTIASRSLSPIATKSQNDVSRSLDEFTGLMIGRMMVMGKAMRLLIPVDDATSATTTTARTNSKAGDLLKSSSARKTKER
jgi:hypothetical protein